MGTQKLYNKSGGFNQYLYHQIGDTIEDNGLKGKVVAKIGDTAKHYSGLPMYSNTSSIYFKLSEVDGSIEQMRLYINRKVAFDFDFGHIHGVFSKGVVHVHEYTNSSGKLVRLPPRLMNNFEIKKYGDLLKKANSNVKFR